MIPCIKDKKLLCILFLAYTIFILVTFHIIRFDARRKLNENRTIMIEHVLTEQDTNKKIENLITSLNDKTVYLNQRLDREHTEMLQILKSLERRGR